MKKILVVALMAVAVVSASAQGRITFASAGVGVNAKFITGSDSPLGVKSLTSADTNFKADLFWTAGSTTVGVTASQLTTAAGFAQAFSSTVAQYGYFTGGTKTVTGWTSGPIVAQVRVWDTSFGSYDVAKVAPGAHWVESALFVITPTLSPTAAPNLVGLGNPATYTLTYNPVPEPSSMALAGLGAASLLIFRRRK